MKRKYIIIILAVILAAVFCYSAYSLIKTWAVYRQNEIEYKEAISEFVIYNPTEGPVQTDASAGLSENTSGDVTGETSSEETEPTETSAGSTATAAPSSDKPDFSIDWEKIKKTNNDIVGWIWMYDTTISYPLLQADDNSKYLYMTYTGAYSKLGSVFLDYRVKSDFTGRNTVIYGHNGGGVKFGVLLNLKSQSYYDSHKYFYILTETETKKYEIFSVFKTDAYGEAYKIYFSGDESYSDYLGYVSASSAVRTGVVPDMSDTVVTLSTCTNNRSNKNERFVVLGRLVK